MAYTEDIPEKVADLLLDQAPRAAGVALTVGEQTARGIGAMTENALNKITQKRKAKNQMEQLRNLKGEISVPSMNELIRTLGMKSRTIRIADSDAKDFDELLRKQHVVYTKMTSKDDDATMYVFLERDQKEVEAARTALFAHRGQVQELQPDLYFSNMAPDNVRSINGLDAVETALFRHYAREQGLLFTVLNRGDKNLVVYDQKDRAKANKALGYMSWDLTGANGAKYRKQVEYHLEGHNKIRMCIEEAERELYIVSRDNASNFIRLTSADYTLYKAGKPVATYERALTPDFETRVMAACDGLRGPMVLDVDDFVEGMTFDDLMDFPTMDLHVPDYEGEVEQSKVNGLANLIAMKYAIDNEGNTPWGVADPSISYSEFSGFEFIMDTDEREARAREFEHFVKSNFYGQDHYEMEDIKLDTKSVDYIIAQAEKKRDAQAGPAPERKEPARTTEQKNTEEKADDGLFL